ncbi:hypothetical protein CON53_21020 [Bacillus cereus]|nr:hypothetical protein CON53_21020 [Bacillus cereus]PFH92835.1 hypothetical protein COI81_03885 [Bacillus cereus]PFM47577.1 hypothetical protein COJ52_29135 [Bacillus cereus]PFS18170.1 hypothetical protein COK55_04595 [Bacillus cereus]PGS28660.1 hypothetical protein COC55_07480 [Bacillus cereus]
MAHSTATPEAPVINIQKYETRTWRSAFVHFAVDWNGTIQIEDAKYIAYGRAVALLLINDLFMLNYVKLQITQNSNTAMINMLNYCLKFYVIVVYL